MSFSYELFRPGGGELRGIRTRPPPLQIQGRRSQEYCRWEAEPGQRRSQAHPYMFRGREESGSRRDGREDSHGNQEIGSGGSEKALDMKGRREYGHKQIGDGKREEMGTRLREEARALNT
jgi:hypothetical protein